MATNPTLYDNFTRVKDWAVDKFADKEQLAYALSDVAFSGDYDDLLNKPDLSTYVTYNALSEMSYATQSYVTNAIAAIPSVDLTGYATETYVTTAIGNLVNSAPAALDTLEELANALGDDPNFATTITNELSYKANSADVYSKTEIQHMSYATTTYVNDAIAAIPSVDLSSYVTKTELNNASYITMADVSACAYITMADVSACAYATALTQSEMDTLFPVSNS